MNRARFTQADVTRAVRGCEAAGMRVGAVEIRADGTITILAAGGQGGRQERRLPRAANPLDRLLLNHGDI